MPPGIGFGEPKSSVMYGAQCICGVHLVVALDPLQPKRRCAFVAISRKEEEESSWLCRRLWPDSPSHTPLSLLYNLDGGVEAKIFS